jgi:hypothetical protein
MRERERERSGHNNTVETIVVDDQSTHNTGIWIDLRPLLDSMWHLSALCERWLLTLAMFYLSYAMLVDVRNYRVDGRGDGEDEMKKMR